MITILALDLGTQCGWAIDESRSGTWDLHIRTGESEGMRFIRFENHLREILFTPRGSPMSDSIIDLVVFEDVKRHLGTQAAHVYGGLQSSVFRICDTLHINYQGFGVGEIKRFATGKGNAPKDKMIEAAGRLFPLARIEDDNHADALCLLALARSKYCSE